MAWSCASSSRASRFRTPTSGASTVAFVTCRSTASPVRATCAASSTLQPPPSAAQHSATCRLAGQRCPWLLRRLGVRHPRAGTVKRLRLTESPPLGRGMRIHLVEADQRAFVVIESDYMTTQHCLHGIDVPRSHPPAAASDAWLARFIRCLERQSSVVRCQHYDAEGPRP